MNVLTSNRLPTIVWKGICALLSTVRIAETWNLRHRSDYVAQTLTMTMMKVILIASELYFTVLHSPQDDNGNDNGNDNEWGWWVETVKVTTSGLVDIHNVYLKRIILPLSGVDQHKPWGGTPCSSFMTRQGPGYSFLWLGIDSRIHSIWTWNRPSLLSFLTADILLNVDRIAMAWVEMAKGTAAEQTVKVLQGLRS